MLLMFVFYFRCLFSVLKIDFFVADFREERRQILEMVGPELQSTYDDRYIEVNDGSFDLSSNRILKVLGKT